MNINRYVFPLLAIPVLVTCVAVCQQMTGTVVVVTVTPHDAAVAADSRGTIKEHGQIRINDHVCKISTFDNKVIFAASGYESRFDPTNSNIKLWSAFNVAADAYSKIRKSNSGGIGIAATFIHKWAESMTKVLVNDLSRGQPPSNPTHVVLGAVVIDFDLFHRIEVHVTTLRFVNGEYLSPDFFQLDKNGAYNGFGEAAIVEEFDQTESQRARGWHKQIDNLPMRQRVAAIANLVKRFDKSGTVGGRIDSVYLGDSGIESDVKPECKSAN